MPDDERRVAARRRLRLQVALGRMCVCGMWTIQNHVTGTHGGREHTTGYETNWINSYDSHRFTSRDADCQRIAGLHLRHASASLARSGVVSTIPTQASWSTLARVSHTLKTRVIHSCYQCCMSVDPASDAISFLILLFSSVVCFIRHCRDWQMCVIASVCSREVKGSSGTDHASWLAMGPVQKSRTVPKILNLHMGERAGC